MERERPRTSSSSPRGRARGQVAVRRDRRRPQRLDQRARAQPRPARRPPRPLRASWWSRPRARSCTRPSTSTPSRRPTCSTTRCARWMAFAEAEGRTRSRRSPAAWARAARRSRRARRERPRARGPAQLAPHAQPGGARPGRRRSPTTTPAGRAPSRSAARPSALACDLPLFPTTTIGSYPADGRDPPGAHGASRGRDRPGRVRAPHARRDRAGDRFQEEIGLDVLVHGEPERNDMVQYFAEQMDGYVVHRERLGAVLRLALRAAADHLRRRVAPEPDDDATGSRYAQSLTEQPVKGMLTGPVTMLQWSFVRDDQPRSETCEQLALAIRDEVADLEARGHQGDPGRRAGDPRGAAAAPGPLGRVPRAGRSTRFRVATAVVRDETQIQTHMCYSEFGDIMEQIQQMDADVLLIEAARSRMELLHDWERTGYAQEIGPGVYDIHSPRVPSTEEMVELLQAAARGARARAALGQSRLRPEDPRLARGRGRAPQHGRRRPSSCAKSSFRPVNPRSGRLRKKLAPRGSTRRPFGRRGAATSRAGCALRPLATSSSCRHFGLSAPSGVCDPP